jgi:hypothetical protein
MEITGLHNLTFNYTNLTLEIILVCIENKILLTGKLYRLI